MKNKISILIISMSLILLSIYTYNQVNIIKEQEKQKILTHLEKKYGNGNFKIISKKNKNYIIKSSYMKDTFNISIKEPYDDNYIDIYSNTVWHDSLDNHMKQYVKDRINFDLIKNKTYFNINVKQFTKLNNNSMYGHMPKEEDFLKFYGYQITNLVIDNFSNNKQDINNNLISSYNVFTKLVYNPFMFFSFKNNINPLSNNDPLYKNGGYITKYENKFYIYYNSVPTIIQE